MQIGKVINLKNYRDFIFLFKKNKVLILFLIFFILGFFIGTVSLDKFQGFKDFFSSRLEEFIKFRTDNSIIKISFDTFIFYLTFIISAFVIGSSFLGIVFLPFIVAFCGIYYGGIMALLYSEYSLKGVAFSAVMILPSAVIFAVCMILAVQESACFSIRISKLTLPKTVPANLFYDFKNYCGRYLFIIILTLFAALIDGIISGNFINNFKL